MKAVVITKDKTLLRIKRDYTDAGLTYQLADGSYAFSDGDGHLFRSVKVMLPGYDYVYGEADASKDYDDTHSALREQSPFPQGSKIYYFNQVTAERS